MASFIYDRILLDVFKGRVDFDSLSFRVMLLGDGYRPDKNEHSRRSDLTDEITGQGYEPGGVEINVRVTMVDGVLMLSLPGYEWRDATLSARYAAYVANRGGEPDEDEVVALIDFGGDVTSTNAPWTLTASTMKLRN